MWVGGGRGVPQNTNTWTFPHPRLYSVKWKDGLRCCHTAFITGEQVLQSLIMRGNPGTVMRPNPDKRPTSHQPAGEFSQSSILCPVNPQALLLLINLLPGLFAPAPLGWFLSLPFISRSWPTVTDWRRTSATLPAGGWKSSAGSSFWVVGCDGVLRLCLIGGIFKTERCVSRGNL